MKDMLRLIALGSVLTMGTLAFGQKYKLQVVGTNFSEFTYATPYSISSKSLLYMGNGFKDEYYGVVQSGSDYDLFKPNPGVVGFVPTYERINDARTVVGNIWYSPPPDYGGDGVWCGVGGGFSEVWAFMRREDGNTEFIRVPDANTYLFGLNDQGVAVGGVESYDDYLDVFDYGYPYLRMRPLIVDAKGPRVLDPPLEELGFPPVSSYLVDINNVGHMVGTVFDPAYGMMGSYLWNQKGIFDLPGQVAAINNRGDIVGTIEGPDGNEIGYMLTSAGVLSKLDFGYFWPKELDSSGQASGPNKGTRTWHSSSILDINDFGQIVVELRATYQFSSDGYVYYLTFFKHVVGTPVAG